MKSDKLCKIVMLITAIVGVLATILYVIVSNNIDDDMGMAYLIVGHWVYYPVVWLVINYGFKWKFKKETRWISTLVTLPLWFEILVCCVFGMIETLSVEIFMYFMIWYSMIGITISALIFEYRFFSCEKKEQSHEVVPENLEDSTDKSDFNF